MKLDNEFDATARQVAVDIGNIIAKRLDLEAPTLEDFVVGLAPTQEAQQVLKTVEDILELITGAEDLYEDDVK